MRTPGTGGQVRSLQRAAGTETVSWLGIRISCAILLLDAPPDVCTNKNSWQEKTPCTAIRMVATVGGDRPKKRCFFCGSYEGFRPKLPLSEGHAPYRRIADIALVRYNTAQDPISVGSA